MSFVPPIDGIVHIWHCVDCLLPKTAGAHLDLDIQLVFDGNVAIDADILDNVSKLLR